jgi:hypothetical protein
VRLSHVAVWSVSLRLRPATLRTAAARPVLVSVLAVLMAAAHALALPATAGDPVANDVSVTVAPAPPELVVIEEGRVTVDAHDADLADVLAQLGARARFRVRTTGSLGRVTATFTAMSVEQALRRLVEDHELMLVYGAASNASVRPTLIQADVFASALSAAQVRAASEMLGRQRAGLLAEINRLRRSRDVARGAPRLAELLGTAPDSIVRARAASALAALNGPLSQTRAGQGAGGFGARCACPGRSRASDRGGCGSHPGPRPGYSSPIRTSPSGGWPHKCWEASGTRPRRPRSASPHRMQTPLSAARLLAH